MLFTSLPDHNCGGLGDQEDSMDEPQDPHDESPRGELPRPMPLPPPKRSIPLAVVVLLVVLVGLLIALFAR
jgi:hypothetical protein